jgi:hypothetical protein
MSGIVDRTKHQENPFPGSTIDREAIEGNTAVLESILRQYTPKARFDYGQVGLGLAEGKPLVEALKEPYGRFVKRDDAREAAIKGGASKLAISKALESPKIGTLKQGRNTSNQTLYGIEPGKTGFVTSKQILSVPGVFVPIDKSQKISVSPTGEVTITEGDLGDTKTKNLARDLKISTFKMNNAANNLFKNLEGAKTGPVGAFVTALDSTGAQLKMAADSFGFKTTGENRTFIDTGSGDIDNYIEKNFGSFVGNDAVQLGKIKSASINLAYLMARIDEPGGRFTDRDIALKMEELGIGANPERTIAIMQNAIKLRNDNAAFEYEELTGNPLDFSKMNVFEGGYTSTSTKKEDDGPRGMKKIFNPLGIDSKLLAD